MNEDKEIIEYQRLIVALEESLDKLPDKNSPEYKAISDQLQETKKQYVALINLADDR